MSRRDFITNRNQEAAAGAATMISAMVASPGGREFSAHPCIIRSRKGRVDEPAALRWNAAAAAGLLEMRNTGCRTSGTKVALHDLSGAVEDTVIVYDFPFVNAVTIRLPGPDA